MEKSYPKIPEIPEFTQPDIYDIFGDNELFLEYYKEYPDYFYIGCIPAGYTIAIKISELENIINTLRKIGGDDGI